MCKAAVKLSSVVSYHKSFPWFDWGLFVLLWLKFKSTCTDFQVKMVGWNLPKFSFSPKPSDRITNRGKPAQISQNQSKERTEFHAIQFKLSNPKFWDRRESGGQKKESRLLESIWFIAVKQINQSELPNTLINTLRR